MSAKIQLYHQGAWPMPNAVTSQQITSVDAYLATKETEKLNVEVSTY